MRKYVSKFNKALSAGIYELMILLLLKKNPTPMYSYQIMKRLQKISNGKIKIRHNVVYTILNKLERSGFVTEKQVQVGTAVRKYYTITIKGEAYLEKILKKWRTYVRTIRNIQKRSFLFEHKARGELKDRFLF